MFTKLIRKQYNPIQNINKNTKNIYILCMYVYICIICNGFSY